MPTDAVATGMSVRMHQASCGTIQIQSPDDEPANGEPSPDPSPQPGGVSTRLATLAALGVALFVLR